MSAAVGYAGRICGRGTGSLCGKGPGGRPGYWRIFKIIWPRHIAEPPAKPKKIIELTELPTTTVGKIFKPRLRELAVQEKIRQEIERIAGEGSIVDLTTETLKRGLLTRLS